MVHNPRLTGLINNLAVAKPLFKLRSIYSPKGVLIASNVDGVLQFLTGTQIVNRSVMVHDDHHSHVGNCIAVITVINHAGFETIEVALSSVIQTAHLLSWRKNVSELLPVDILA